jgi:hypothetical protein
MVGRVTCQLGWGFQLCFQLIDIFGTEYTDGHQDKTLYVMREPVSRRFVRYLL